MVEGKFIDKMRASINEFYLFKVVFWLAMHTHVFVLTDILVNIVKQQRILVCFMKGLITVTFVILECIFSLPTNSL